MCGVAIARFLSHQAQECCGTDPPKGNFRSPAQPGSCLCFFLRERRNPLHRGERGNLSAVRARLRRSTGLRIANSALRRSRIGKVERRVDRRDGRDPEARLPAMAGSAVEKREGSPSLYHPITRISPSKPSSRNLRSARPTDFASSSSGVLPGEANHSTTVSS